MGRADARIDRSRIGDTLTLPSGTELGGRFFLGIREHSLPDGAIITLEISYNAPAHAELLALPENALVQVNDGEWYRLLARLPDQGDETGRVLLELGTRR